MKMLGLRPGRSILNNVFFSFKMLHQLSIYNEHVSEKNVKLDIFEDDKRQNHNQAQNQLYNQVILNIRGVCFGVNGAYKDTERRIRFLISFYKKSKKQSVLMWL